MRVVAGPRGTKPLVAFFRLQAVRSAEGAAVLSQPRHAARVKLGWAAMGQAGLRHSRLCAAQARWPRGPRITVCRMMCGCPRRRSSQAFLRLVAPSLRPARRGASRPGQSAAHSPSRGFGRVGLPASQQHGTALRGRSPACPLEKAPGDGSPGCVPSRHQALATSRSCRRAKAPSSLVSLDHDASCVVLVPYRHGGAQFCCTDRQTPP